MRTDPTALDGKLRRSLEKERGPYRRLCLITKAVHITILIGITSSAAEELLDTYTTTKHKNQKSSLVDQKE